MIDTLRHETGDCRLHHEQPMPTRERDAHGQIEILGQRIRRPAAGLSNRRSPPNAAGAVELKQPAAAKAPGLFDDEMRVEHHALHPRQPIGAVVRELAARLHEAGIGVRDQDRHDIAKPMRRRPKIDIEQSDQRRAADAQTGFQGARLEPGAILAPDVRDFNAARCQIRHDLGDEDRRIVGGIVQHLDMQLVARPIERHGGLDRAERNLVFVEQRNLHQHIRQVHLRQESPRKVVTPVRRSEKIVDLDPDQGEEAAPDSDQAERRDVEARLEKAEEKPMHDQGESSSERSGVWRPVIRYAIAAYSKASNVSCGKASVNKSSGDHGFFARL